MKNNIKRMKAVIIVASLIMSILFMEGCNKSTSVITDKIVKPVPLKGKLVLWCDKSDEAILKNIAKSFEEKNSGVKIIVSTVNENKIEQRLQKLEDSGKTEDFPNILEVGTQRVNYLVNTFPDYFSKTGVPHTGILDWKLEETSVDGKNYAVPWDTDPRMMLYNDDIFKKKNIDAFSIKTWNDFTEVGKKLGKDNIKMLTEYKNKQDNIFSVMCRELNFNVYNDDDEVEINEEKLYKVLEQEKLIYQSGITDISKDQEDSIEKLMRGKAAAMIADSSVINEIKNNQKYNKYNWRVERLPAFEAGGKNSACGIGKAFMKVDKSKNNITDRFVQYIMGDKKVNEEIIKDRGYISSSTDVYVYSYFNKNVSEFSNNRLWRFMSETAEEEKPILYGQNYENIMKHVTALAKKVVNNDGKKISDSEIIEKGIDDIVGD